MERNRKYNILFSIPVHEKPEVVIDMIINIQKFNPNCCIVLHLSRDFSFDSKYIKKEQFIHSIESMNDVLVNPNRLRSGYEDIIQCHISNYRYACEKIDFEYVVFAASNELFFRQGLWNEISKYDCGPKYSVVVDNNTTWIQGIHALQDYDFINELKKKRINQIYGGQFEGSFIKKNMMQRICDEIDSFYDYKSMTVKYAREEIFFYTFLYAFFPDANYKNEYTTYMNFYNNLNVSVSEAMNLVKGVDGFFSLKRVPRQINDEVRRFIREYIGNYSSECNRFFENDGMDGCTLFSKREESVVELKYDVINRWLLNNHKKKRIFDYLKENKYYNISIYGFGDLGKLLYYEIHEEGSIRIESIIDKANPVLDENIEISNPFPKLHSSEMIIVTVVGEDDLISDLETRYDIPVVGIQEIVNRVSSMDLC